MGTFEGAAFSYRFRNCNICGLCEGIKRLKNSSSYFVFPYFISEVQQQKYCLVKLMEV